MNPLNHVRLNRNKALTPPFRAGLKNEFKNRALALRILFRNMSFMVRAKALSEFDVSDIALKGDVNAFIFAS